MTKNERKPNDDKPEFVKLEEYIMLAELGISGGTAIIVLIVLYFIVKWAVKNGIKEAYEDITGKKPMEDIKLEKQLGLSDNEELK
jgi:hypothetical protein